MLIEFDPKSFRSFSHQLEHQKTLEQISQPVITNGSNGEEKVHRIEPMETPVRI